MSSKEEDDKVVSYSFITQKELKKKFKWFEHKIHVGLKHRVCWQAYKSEENSQLLRVRDFEISRRRRLKISIFLKISTLSLSLSQTMLSVISHKQEVMESKP